MVLGNKNDDGQGPTRWVSPWLFLALFGLLAVGVRQTFYPGVKQVEATNQTQVVPATELAETDLAIADRSHRHQNISWGTGNFPADQLGKLLQDLLAEGDSNMREELIGSYLAGVKAEDISAALEILKNTEPSDFVSDLSQRLVQRWAGGDPQAVAAWTSRLPAGPQRQAALDGLAIVWANSQLTIAISWGQSLADEAERNRALAAVANEAVRADPMTSLQIAIDLPADSQRGDLIRRAAMEWASKDAPSAVAWAKQIPEASLRAKLLASEAVAWADQDPESAAILAVEELPAGRLQEDTVISIVQRWAQQQPEAAAAWVEQFPKGAARDAAIENLIAQWSQKAPAEAQQWLAKHS